MLNAIANVPSAVSYTHLPPGCPKDYYRTLLRAVDGLGCRCILDAEGERLALGIEASPYPVSYTHLDVYKRQV